MTTQTETQSNWFELLPASIQRAIPYYILAVLILYFYSNVYENTLIYDDNYLILKNTYLRSWSSLGDIFTTYLNSGAYRTGHFYRPLQNVLFLIVYQIGGVTLFGFHLLNVSLHIINACLVFTLGRKLAFNAWASFFGAVIWALHPIQTEAITYMSATADPLYACFSLLSVIVLLPDFSPRRFLISVPMFLLGLLSKEAAIIVPLLAMSCLYYVSPERFKIKTYFCTWPLWAVAAMYMAIRFTFMPLSNSSMLNVDPTSLQFAQNISWRIFTFLATLPAYGGLLIWPVGLHMDRDFPVYINPYCVEVAAGFLVVLISAVVIGIARARFLPLSWGLLWFASAHVPQTGIVQPVNALFLEHWMYLPTVGFALGIAQTIVNLSVSAIASQLSAIAATILALVLGIMTYNQNAVWHNPVTFYLNIFDHGETSARARVNLGVIYMDAGQYDKAMEQFQLAQQQHDLMPEVHQDIAALLSKKNDGKSHVDEEIAELHRALELNPNFIPAYDALANVYDFIGDKEKAATNKQKADALRKGFRP